MASTSSSHNAGNPAGRRLPQAVDFDATRYKLQWRPREGTPEREPKVTNINDIADLAQVLQDNPQWRDIIRAILLGDEMLEIPGRIADLISINEMIVERLERLEAGQAKLESSQTRLEAGQAKLESSQTRLESGQAKLESSQTRLEAGQAKLESSQTRLESGQAKLESSQTRLEAGQARLESGMTNLSSRFGNIIGSDYERRAAQSARRLVRLGLGIRRARVLLAKTAPDRNEIPELLNEAAENGIVSDDEADDLLLADIILTGEGAGGETAYAVCETSVTLYDQDVLRAKRRAGILQRASGLTVLPAVIGQSAPQGTLDLADRENVAFLCTPDEDGPE
jgi:exonuclease VII small subunit